MNTSQTILCRISSANPIKTGNTTLSELFARGLSIEDRIRKGANLQDERARYCLVCKRIETTGAILLSTQGSAIPTQLLGPDYFEILALVHRKMPEKAQYWRIGATFFPAESVKQHWKASKNLARKIGVRDRTEVQRRTKFLRQAFRRGQHVIEIQNGFSGEKIPPPKPGLFQRLFGPPSRPEEDSEETDYQRNFKSQPVSDTITEATDKGYLEMVRERTLRTVKTVREGQLQALNFSNMRNDIITKVLHEFVYGEVEGSRRPIRVKVVYDDGSEARTFPLLCLQQKGQEELTTIRKQPPIQVGLISARHPKMDFKVDIYWYRNQEISVARTQAETDEIGYQKSKELLEKTRGEGPYKIHLYQTGFEPALVGFFRALVEELQHRGGSKPSLEVVPYFYIQGKYEKGKPWN